jgi:surfactin synthase thioesterase subunit
MIERACLCASRGVSLCERTNKQASNEPTPNLAMRDPALADLLSACSLSHLGEPLASTSLEALFEASVAGRPKLLAELKETGVEKLSDRQKLATALAKAARGVDLGPAKKRAESIMDLDLARDIAKQDLQVHSHAVLAEMQALPKLGSTSPLPGEACDAVRPDARIRLICFYGASDSAAAFDKWARDAPRWLEVRAVELPGHGARRAEGVWPLGLRGQQEGLDEDESGEALVADILRERAVAMSSLVDLIEPLCHGHYALYGFSSGAMLAYLVTVEMQRRAAATAAPANVSGGGSGWPAKLPFRLVVCGRGAPHCVHASLSFWRMMRLGTDADVTTALNELLGVPVDSDPDAMHYQASLWRAAIVPAMVHVGSGFTVPPPDKTPAFPLPMSTADKKNANPYAEGAPKITCCPLVVIGSNQDKVWPWGQPARWEDVAGAGVRLDEVDGVPHFRLMCAEPVVALATRELCGAALGQARFS